MYVQKVTIFLIVCYPAAYNFHKFMSIMKMKNVSRMYCVFWEASLKIFFFLLHCLIYQELEKYRKGEKLRYKNKHYILH